MIFWPRLVVLAAFALTACATTQATCHLDEVGTFPVSYVAGDFPVINVQVAGKTLQMVVDTGAVVSFINPSTAKALGIRYAIWNSRIALMGVGGTRQGAFLTQQDVEIGQVSLPSQLLLIGGVGFVGPRHRTYNDGMLGNNILTQFDIAFDLPHNRLNFFLSAGCNGTEITPWPGAFAVEPLRRSEGDGGVTVPYSIDGKPLQALIDSGFSQTLAFQATLSRNGIVPEQAPANDILMGHGFGPAAMVLHRERFASLEIGAEDYSDPWINIGDNPIGRSTDMIVGEDYLHSHRVFISNSTGKIYLGLNTGLKAQ